MEADLPSIPGKPCYRQKAIFSRTTDRQRSGFFQSFCSAITCLLQEDSAKDGLKEVWEKRKESSGILTESWWCLLQVEFSLKFL